NKAENYTAWVCTVMPSEFDSPLYESDSLLAEPDSFSLNMNAFQARDTAFIDLVPLLKEHTRTEEGVMPPDGAYTYTKDGEYTTTVRMKVFDSKASQEEIPLLGNIFLSGIGWIDGQLHVQLHIQGRDVLETDSNRKSNACMVGVTCFITGKTNDEVRADGSPVIWDENNNLFPEWYEYVFNCTPDDVDQMMLNADLGVYTDMLYDDWSVEIPMNLLLQKDRNGNIEYEINPEGFKNGLTAEAIPDADLTLVTEAEMIREVMDAHVEEVAYDELAPIGLSMEKQGIRMEVVSGCRKGDNAYFLLTTQELNGEYSDYSCDPPHDLQTEDGTVYGHYIRLRINRTENTTTWLYCVDLSKAPLAENNALRVGIEELDFKEEREVDLLPLLELDGRTEEGITLPENYPVFTIDGKRAEDGLKVLSDEGSLDIHLDGNTYLSAIGWIGDQLHVQLVRKNEKLPDPAYNDLRLFINCNVTGKPYEEIREDGSPVSWFNLQNETSREEYIFNCTPEDVDSMRLYGYGTIMRASLRDDWSVEVPLEQVQDLTAYPAKEILDRLDSSGFEAGGYIGDYSPVNLGVEKQGIRMDVVSGVVTEDEAFFLCEVQGTGEKYDGADVIFFPWNDTNGNAVDYRIGQSDRTEGKTVLHAKVKL
ncbi:MAG: hypothetical protein J6Y48_02215, partial [Clostridia bacterium]|nr:hypothetical protein [Clostridia bacterium]